jgi:large subunit ribosomal protein L13
LASSATSSISGCAGQALGASEPGLEDHEPHAKAKRLCDFVIVINADKVSLSGAKLEDKKAYRHSGYPGGLRAVSYADLMAKHPERAVEKAVKGMLPKNSLGRKTLGKLKVYAGPTHPHQAQQPQPYEIRQISQ